MTVTTTAQSRAVKARGREGENKIAAVFGVLFPMADRKIKKGSEDEGDVCGVDDLTIEAKAWNTMSLGQWLDEALIEQAHNGSAWAVVAHKRRGKGDAHRWFATQELGDFVRMYHRLQELESAERRRRRS